MAEPLKKIERHTLIIAWAGLIVASITGVVFYCQLREMSRQTKILSDQAKQGAADSIVSEGHTREQLRIANAQADAAQNGVKAIQRQMRQDQRAWITISFGKVTGGEGHPVSLPVVITNTGKTAAKKYVVKFVVRRVENTRLSGESLIFSYPKPYMRDSGGFILPAVPATVVLNEVEESADNKSVVPHLLSHQEYARLEDGTDFVIFFAMASYYDIFGTPHWIKTCSFSSPSGKNSFAKRCTSYNNVDNN